jgi:hypothetical protein
MISKLNITEFKGRLKYHTKIGDPILKLTPFIIFTIFSKTGKIFYGGYDDSQFELTKNAEYWPIPYIIKGTYRAKNKSETELTFEIKTIKFYYWITRIFSMTPIFIINFILITRMDKSQLNIFLVIIMNLVLIPLFSLPFIIEKQMRKGMEKRFRNIFVVED